MQLNLSGPFGEWWAQYMVCKDCISVQVRSGHASLVESLRLNCSTHGDDMPLTFINCKRIHSLGRVSSAYFNLKQGMVVVLTLPTKSPSIRW